LSSVRLNSAAVRQAGRFWRGAVAAGKPRASAAAAAVAAAASARRHMQQVWLDCMFGDAYNKLAALQAT
jgi:hypothetical protein